MNQTTSRIPSDRVPAGAADPAHAPGAVALHPDVVIRRLAAGQHGIVSRKQLLAGGLSPAQIDRRVCAGRLDRLYRGIFRAGPAAAPLEREMAAVLAAGRPAWLSHGTAGRISMLLPPARTAVPVEITVVGGYGEPGAGVRVRRVSAFDAAEVTCRDGLPITTPERTLLDLAGLLETRSLEQALARGVREQILTLAGVEAVLARHPGRRGTRPLRALLAAAAGPAFTRSEAETRFLELMRRAGIREAETNVLVRGFEVDFFWRPERLVLEIDGYAFHNSRDAFERDRTRDAVLAAAGVRVLRVTWRQLDREPTAVAARVAQALGRSFVS